MTQKFPSKAQIDWAMLEGESGAWWYTADGHESNPVQGEVIPRKEPTDVLVQRIEGFKNWLNQRSERC